MLDSANRRVVVATELLSQLPCFQDIPGASAFTLVVASRKSQAVYFAVVLLKGVCEELDDW